MASSKHALRLLRRSVPSAPYLIRRIVTTPSRPSSTSSSQTPATPGAASENKSPYGSSQVSPPTAQAIRSSSLFSSYSSSSSSTTTTTTRSRPLSGKPSNPNPLHVDRIPTDEIPPYKYPSQDPTPLPSVKSSFDPTLAQSPIAAALNQQSPETIDWGTSYHGLSTEPFSKEAQAILQAPIPDNDVEVKPDGIIYLPEIKYRRILNAAFGPGGWGLAPRGELHVGEKVVTREFALVVGGRFVAQARGECGYYGDDNIPNAVEGCKSNALTRCCKDLGIASELWDPRFIRKWTKEYTKQVDVYYGTGVSARKRKITIRKDDEVLPPYRLIDPPRTTASSSSTTSSYKPSNGSGSYGSSSAARTTTAAKSTATTARPAVKTTTTAPKA